MTTKYTIAVLGAGAWGCAVAKLLSENGHRVCLWCYEEEVANSINTHHVNDLYLPKICLPKALTVTTDLNKAVADAAYVFEAIPVKFLRSMCLSIDKKNVLQKTWIVLSKGLEDDTLMLPSQIIQDVFCLANIAVVSGPNFAAEVCSQVFTGTVVASSDAATIKNVSALLKNDWFKIYASPDPIGIQITGAFKNIIALGMGIAHGGDIDGYNTRSLILSRGLEEMAILSAYWGGTKDSAYSLAGIGDLFLTCTGTLSKNLRAGIMVGQGQSIDAITEKFPTLPEGFNTVKALYALATKNNLDLPLCVSIYRCIYQQKSASLLLAAL